MLSMLFLCAGSWLSVFGECRLRRTVGLQVAGTPQKGWRPQDTGVLEQECTGVQVGYVSVLSVPMVCVSWVT